jgi:hypothetical protein
MKLARLLEIERMGGVRYTGAEGESDVEAFRVLKVFSGLQWLDQESFR